MRAQILEFRRFAFRPLSTADVLMRPPNPERRRVLKSAQAIAQWEQANPEPVSAGVLAEIESHKGENHD